MKQTNQTKNNHKEILGKQNNIFKKHQSQIRNPNFGETLVEGSTFIFWWFLLRQEQCWGKAISTISKGTNAGKAVVVKVLLLQEFNLSWQNGIMKNDQSNMLFCVYEAISQYEQLLAQMYQPVFFLIRCPVVDVTQISL